MLIQAVQVNEILNRGVNERETKKRVLKRIETEQKKTMKGGRKWQEVKKMGNEKRCEIE